MLDAAREYASNLVRWLNFIYGKQEPPLVIGDHKFPSREGAQQDDPATMLIFPPVIQPLLIKVCNSCDLKLNVVYADDGKVGGYFLEVHKAREILSDESPLGQYYLQLTTALGYGRAMTSTKIAALVRAYPMDMGYHDAGVTVFGMPIGDNSHVCQCLDDEFASIDRVLTLILKMAAICDIRLAFHAHRLCPQACQFVNILCLTPPTQMLPHLPRFDATQLASTRSSTLSVCKVELQSNSLFPNGITGMVLLRRYPLQNWRVLQVSLTLRRTVCLCRASSGGIQCCRGAACNLYLLLPIPRPASGSYRR
jgi:hypothetical protein